MPSRPGFRREPPDVLHRACQDASTPPPGHRSGETARAGGARAALRARRGHGPLAGRGDAPSTDEPLYVTDGLAALERHDLRLNPQHPPLAKALAAVPVLLAHPSLPAGFRHGHGRPYSRRFENALYRAGLLREVTFLARLVPVLELLLTVLAVFALARRLAGPAGGLFAAALWALDPFVIGLGHVDGIDLPATVSALGLSLALAVAGAPDARPPRDRRRRLRRGARRPRHRPLLVAIGVLTVGAAARDVRPAIVVSAVAYAVLWVVYGTLDPAYTLHHLNALPQRYLDGLGRLEALHRHPATAFLLGHHYRGGRWWYYGASIVIKLPVTLLVSYALAPLFLAGHPSVDRRRVLVAVLPAAAALGAFTVATPVNLGLRYLLAVLALVTVCVAPIAHARRALPVLLVLGSAAFTIASLPHSTAWVSPPFDPGYRVVTADNLDWGQDAFRLQRWATGRRAWVGCYSPWRRCAQVIPGARLLHKNTRRASVHGWLGISASLVYLHGWDPRLTRLRPVGTLDGTELLYRVP
jgi:hypothetical protein